MTSEVTPLENDQKTPEKKAEKTPEPKKDEKKPLHGLVVGANMVSILLILGIFFTIYKMAVWRSESSDKNQKLAEQSALNIMFKDSSDAANAYQHVLDSMNNHTGSLDASTQELTNSLKYSQLDADLGTTGKDGKLRSAMETLKSKANTRIAAIEKMKTDLDDQVSKGGSYNRISTTQEFFITNGRANDLLSDLKEFRDDIVSEVSRAGVDNMSETKEHMPLDDWSSTTGAQTWDIYEFQGDPDNAKQFLGNLETELRLFEGSVLDKITAARY